MTHVDAIILGLIQGLTEFLPISSDGHLVLAGALLAHSLNGADALGFDILLHAGSVLAILVMYRTMLLQLVRAAWARERDAWALIALLVLATIPGVIAGFFLEDAVSNMRSFRAAGLGFLITGIVLIVGEYVGRTAHSAVPLHAVGVRKAMMIGVAQAVAILPGVSRSGCTISAGRALGLARSTAVDFSFLMALPIIGGAIAKTLADALVGSVTFPAPAVSAAGLVASFGMSMCAIMLLKLLVVRRSVAVFAWYLLPLSAILLIGDMLGWQPAY